jgi:hypothetical protein
VCSGLLHVIRESNSVQNDSFEAGLQHLMAKVLEVEEAATTLRLEVGKSSNLAVSAGAPRLEEPVGQCWVGCSRGLVVTPAAKEEVDGGSVSVSCVYPTASGRSSGADPWWSGGQADEWSEGWTQGTGDVKDVNAADTVKCSSGPKHDTKKQKGFEEEVDGGSVWVSCVHPTASGGSSGADPWWSGGQAAAWSEGWMQGTGGVNDFNAADTVRGSSGPKHVKKKQKGHDDERSSSSPFSSTSLLKEIATAEAAVPFCGDFSSKFKKGRLALCFLLSRVVGTGLPTHIAEDLLQDSDWKVMGAAALYRGRLADH